MNNNRQVRIENDMADLLKAIQDEGSHPIAHREIMRRHRQEWPTLWILIDDLLHAKNMTLPIENYPKTGPTPILTRNVNGSFLIDWNTVDNKPGPNPVLISSDILSEMVGAINRALSFQ